MSRKRQNTSSPEPDDTSSPKRQDTRDAEDSYDESWDDSDEEENNEAPLVSEYTGQLGAFPGLKNAADDLFYGPAADGIDYLRMVRSEAKGVPLVLTASAPQDRDVSDEDRQGWSLAEEGGYYDDGTYIAVAEDIPSAKEHSFSSAQQCYYDSLLTQFKLLQATMRCTPPLSKIQNLASSQFISFPEDSRKVRWQWVTHMTTSDPNPVQIACMDCETILQLVRLLKTKLNVLIRHQTDAAISRVGAWVWAVLGKCKDRGELTSEDIGSLRELAQKAIQMQSNIHVNPGATASWQYDNPEDEESDEEGSGVEDGRPQDATTRSQDQLEQTEDSAAVECTGRRSKEDLLIAPTLDMIITVVGEVYGQRDLLEMRQKWGEDEVEVAIKST